jgi:alpha-glucosidase (family GH31 glycosyl hydrolase)
VRALDLTSDAAVEWFVARLEALQRSAGLDGFKFDAGEPCFLPRGAKTHRPLRYPAEYTQLWVTKVVSRFPLSEVRSAAGTTEYPGLVRMGDRDTLWGADNGLQSLIPALLTAAVLGYPFCLPDMVGGNAYWGQYPDTELMARWAQVSVMMPAVQWSIPPWQVSAEAMSACAAAMRAREQVLLPRLPALAAAAADALTPICRPMWWLDPSDPETFDVDDQFAIGEDVIVAPVVIKGARRRRVYLTVGEWSEWSEEGGSEDGSGGNSRFRGPSWITVDAPLAKLPIFIKVA